ncbi:MAG: hypothetical protein R3E95_00695 [Thiolinea sp.]
MRTSGTGMAAFAGVAAAFMAAFAGVAVFAGTAALAAAGALPASAKTADTGKQSRIRMLVKKCFFIRIKARK